MNDSRDTTFEQHRRGRSELSSWLEAKPSNAYESDSHLKFVLPIYAAENRLEPLRSDLRDFGEAVAGPVDRLVQKNNRLGNGPSVDRYTDIGERIEQIDHHPTYHEAGKYIYGSGITEAYKHHPNFVGALARFYLSSYNGEAGHNCAVGCTAGVIRVLQEVAGPELTEKYLPDFLSRDYENHLEGAQFLTEIQGGSDVGANATRAVEDGDGQYRLYGEKWFCSNVDADVFLMTARFEDGPPGTKGLGLFFVPRRLDDGSVNHFSIRRLKEKIGTRTLASAECDFEGAVGYHMGEPKHGFKHMMNHVINVSRLYNAFSCAGFARRSYVEAQTYARHRSAFGRVIGDYPLVRETLADVKAETDAMLSLSMHLAWLQDRRDLGDLDESEQQFLRLGINLNKIYTAKKARWAAVKGIEVFGGNGAIETFTVVPRLLRDAIVSENWEGTHNTLQMQIMRDMQKYGIHNGFFEHLSALLNDCGTRDSDQVESVRRQLQHLRSRLAEMGTADRGAAQLAMRRHLDGLACVAAASIRLWERQRRPDQHSEANTASIRHFVDRRVERSEGGTSSEYQDRIETLASSI